MSEETFVSRGPWECFHCGEVFTTPGAAADHFGAENATPGCLIEYRVALEEGGKLEKGRGLQMALRKAEARNAELERENEELKNRVTNEVIRFSNILRKFGEFIRPGRSIERTIELFHANTPEHVGLVQHCHLWPCLWLHAHSATHTFTPPEQSQIDKGANPKICIICGWQLAEIARHGQ